MAAHRRMPRARGVCAAAGAAVLLRNARALVPVPVPGAAAACLVLALLAWGSSAGRGHQTAKGAGTRDTWGAGRGALVARCRHIHHGVYVDLTTQPAPGGLSIGIRVCYRTTPARLQTGTAVRGAWERAPGAPAVRCLLSRAWPARPPAPPTPIGGGSPKQLWHAAATAGPGIYIPPSLFSAGTGGGGQLSSSAPMCRH